MADKKTSLGKQFLKGGVALGMVGAPAILGQFLSAGLQAKVGFIRSMGEGSMGEALVDFGSGVGIAVAEVGLAYLIGGKGVAIKTIPLALGGAGLCGLIPLTDRGVDKMVQGILGNDAGISAPQLTAPSNVRALPQRVAARVPGGVGLGEQLPGGVGLGEALPGGVPNARGNSAY